MTAVTLLNVGTLLAAPGLFRQGEDLTARRRWPVPAFLLETPEERVLVDTGLHPAAVADPAGHYGGAPALAVFGLEQERHVGEQVDLRTVTRVVLTHLHFDHGGAVGLLPAKVPVVVQRAEWEAVRDPARAPRQAALDQDLAAVEDRLVLVDGEHDLLGDGAVRLVPTPGHTAGHQSVVVDEALVVGGDVVHLAAGLDDLRLPVFGDDLARQADSARALRAWRDAGLRVLPGHDPDVLRPGRLA